MHQDSHLFHLIFVNILIMLVINIGNIMIDYII